MSLAIQLAERGVIPDALIRYGIRRLLRQRLAQESERYADSDALAQFVGRMCTCPIAVATEAANQQHYEVPSRYFETVLGSRLKYSCALFPPGVQDLDQAESQMLGLCSERARLADGQEILELGCGWGSLTLWMAQHYPASQITAVSNSTGQRHFIETRARQLGLRNVHVITEDINTFDPGKQFDRVVSVEMFEHTRNHKLLFERIAGWLNPNGLLFFHIFCHREFAYFFEDSGEDDWMAREFFTGGMMPSWDLPTQFQDSLALVSRWQVPGTHYAETCRQWLARHDKNRKGILKLFTSKDAPAGPEVMFQRWRLFYLACEALFDYDGGNEWYVGHYLFRPCK